MIRSAASVPVGSGQEGASSLTDHSIHARTQTLVSIIPLGIGRSPECLERDGEE